MVHSHLTVNNSFVRLNGTFIGRGATQPRSKEHRSKKDNTCTFPPSLRAISEQL
jgi:hypothetical protein